MAGGFLVLLLLVSICEVSSVFLPISDSHRSAALELFAPVDGSFRRGQTGQDDHNYQKSVKLDVSLKRKRLMRELRNDFNKLGL